MHATGDKLVVSIANTRSHKAERAKLALTRYTLAVPRNGKHDAKRELIRRDFEAEFFSISAARHRRDPQEEGSSR